MKKEVFLIEDVDTGEYLHESGGWVCDFKNAVHFDSYAGAVYAIDCVTVPVSIKKVFIS